MNTIEIIKANGEKVNFEISRLISSLRKAGTSELLAKNIATEIEATLFEGMTTKEIYKKAFSKLRKISKPTAARYKLKKAILELGETGFPFEKFVSELLKAELFQTQVGVIVQGQCVTHEIDVIAIKNELHLMCECKFHNKQGVNCNVKIPLYIHSRFKDVEAHLLKKSGHQTMYHQGWIFTNTRFTSDATQYAECKELKLVSWDYPKGSSLKDRIDKTGIYPITSLTTLSQREKKALIELDIITCKMLCANPSFLLKVNIIEARQKKIMQEAIEVCRTNKSRV